MTLHTFRQSVNSCVIHGRKCFPTVSCLSNVWVCLLTAPKDSMTQFSKRRNHHTWISSKIVPPKFSPQIFFSRFSSSWWEVLRYHGGDGFTDIIFILTAEWLMYREKKKVSNCWNMKTAEKLLNHFSRKSIFQTKCSEFQLTLLSQNKSQEWDGRLSSEVSTKLSK